MLYISIHFHLPCRPWKETPPIPRQRDKVVQVDSKKYLESDTMYSLPVLKSSSRMDRRYTIPQELTFLFQFLSIEKKISKISKSK